MEVERIFVYEPETNDLVELPPHYSGLTEAEINLLIKKKFRSYDLDNSVRMGKI